MLGGAGPGIRGQDRPGTGEEGGQWARLCSCEGPSWGGVALWAAGCHSSQMCINRAPTDNDLGGGECSYAQQWAKVGMSLKENVFWRAEVLSGAMRGGLVQDTTFVSQVCPALTTGIRVFAWKPWGCCVGFSRAVVLTREGGLAPDVNTVTCRLL